MSHKLNFDTELTKFMSETRSLSKIVDIINYHGGHYLRMSGDFLKKETNDTISFIPKSKLGHTHDGFNDVKHRVKIKIGRFVNKFIGESAVVDWGVTNYDIEAFVNIYKSYFDSDITKLKIVEGDDILKYYLQNNYHQPSGSCVGTLWNSCMRYPQKNSYMTIYAKNPDKIKMLVLFDDEGKVKTRALLWEDCSDRNGNKYKVMDRIYSIYDHDVVFFKKWALDNGYIHKLEQSAKSETLFVTKEGPQSIELTTNIENTIFDFYPYIDTFKFFSKKFKSLSNSEFFSYKYVLVQNNGGLVPDEEDEGEEIDMFDDDYIDFNDN